MINREIVYERNVTGSFMRIAAPAEGGVDERLEHEVVDHLGRNEDAHENDDEDPETHIESNAR